MYIVIPHNINYVYEIIEEKKNRKDLFSVRTFVINIHTSSQDAVLD